MPRPTGSASWGVISNDEWLEKLGVDMPTTPEEAYEYGKLVATQDPDGNGKNDTFLYSPYGLWADCWMIFPFLPFSLQHAASYLPDRDGEYKDQRKKWHGYMPYLDFMRKMYAEGIMTLNSSPIQILRRPDQVQAGPRCAAAWRHYQYS